MAYYNLHSDEAFPYEEPEGEKPVPFAYFNSQQRKGFHETIVDRYEEETLPYTVNIQFKGSQVKMTLNVGDYEFVVLAKEVTDYMDAVEGGDIDDDFGVETLELKSVSVTYAKDTAGVRSFSSPSLDGISDGLALVFGFEDGRTFALLREMFDQLVDWYEASRGDDAFDIEWLADAVQDLDDVMVENLEPRNVGEEEIPAENSYSEELAAAA